MPAWPRLGVPTTLAALIFTAACNAGALDPPEDGKPPPVRPPPEPPPPPPPPPPAPRTLRLSPSPVVFAAPGGHYDDFTPSAHQLVAVITDQYGQRMSGIAVGYGIAEGGEAISVDSLGTITPLAAGRALAVATITGTGLTDSVVVVVNNPPRVGRWLHGLWIEEAGGEVAWDAAGAFMDPDGDALTYRAFVAEGRSRDFLAAEVPDDTQGTVMVRSIGGETAYRHSVRITPYRGRTEWTMAVWAEARDQWGHNAWAQAWITVGCPLLMEADPPPLGGFDIELAIDGAPSWDSPCTRSALAAAEAYWEHALAGSAALYEAGGPHLSVSVAEYDGERDDVLGTGWGEWSQDGTRPARGWIDISSLGLYAHTQAQDFIAGEWYRVSFASPRVFMDVVRHEIGHVLGFGAHPWRELLRDPPPSRSERTDVHFVGEEALAAFDSLGGGVYPGQRVPTQDKEPGFCFNCAIAGPHWRDVTDHGLVFINELMAPGSHGGPIAASAVTLAALADMGWIVNMEAAEPYRLFYDDTGAARLAGRHLRPIWFRW